MENATGEGKEVIKKKLFFEKVNKYTKIACKIYIFATNFIIAILSAFLVIVLLYGYNKDGEYCYYTEDWNYNHIVVEGEPCILQWQMLFDFIFIFIIWSVPIQAPAWIILFIL